MANGDDEQRVIERIRLPLWGSVVASGGATPWLVVDSVGDQVEPVAVFLRDLAARDRSASSIRSYAMTLLRWWRFLVAIGIRWDKVTSAEVRDFVLWLANAAKPVASRRTGSRATAGQMNPLTKKLNPGDGYGPATIRHSNAVLRTFYDFWLERGGGPLINPVVVERSRGSRANGPPQPNGPVPCGGQASL